MPTCPGCQQLLSHERLGDHLDHCRAIYGDAAEEARTIARLERRVDRLELRVRKHDLDLERAVDGGRVGTGPDGEGDLPPLRR